MTIAQIAINVRDLARATDFYRDKLGLKFLFSTGSLAFFDCNGVRLMLDQIEPLPSSILYYKVQDLHATTAQFKERGVTFEQDPHLVAKMPDHELWMAFFRDSEANIMALMSEVR